MTQSVDTTEQEVASEPKKKSSWFWVFIWRIFLLGFCTNLAIAGGLWLATVYPKQNPSQPLVVRLWEVWQAKITGTTEGSESDSTTPQEDDANSTENGQSKQLQNQLESLEKQVQQLESQTSQLESQIGNQSSQESIEIRIKALKNQIQGDSTNVATNIASNVSLQAEQLKVTLPSDLLFEKKNSLLSRDAKSILGSIVIDLEQYQGETIIVAAHTDAGEQVQENQQLSFQRAQAVKNYLEEALGEGYRWLILGYGQSRPLVANNTEANRQLNRRIEIAVD